MVFINTMIGTCKRHSSLEIYIFLVNAGFQNKPNALNPFTPIKANDRLCKPDK